MLKSKECNIAGCSQPVWSKGVCKSHTSFKPMKKISTGGRRSEKTHEIMHTLFMHIWRKRRHKSEVSGKPLGSEALSIYFHHILPKHRYKEAAFDPDNIILMTGEEHENVEIDMYRYEEVNKRRESLLKKYNLI